MLKEHDAWRGFCVTYCARRFSKLSRGPQATKGSQTTPMQSFPLIYGGIQEICSNGNLCKQNGFYVCIRQWSGGTSNFFLQGHLLLEFRYSLIMCLGSRCRRTNISWSDTLQTDSYTNSKQTHKSILIPIFPELNTTLPPLSLTSQQQFPPCLVQEMNYEEIILWENWWGNPDADSFFLMAS